MLSRAEILKAAEVCVNGDRQNDYGTPEHNFQTIANLWNDYIFAMLGCKDGMRDVLKPKDVAAMLVLLKVARIASGKKKNDNWIDIAGYAACGGEIESQSKISANKNTDI